MGGIFKKIAKIVGTVLTFVPGFQVVGALLLTASAANEAVSQRKQGRAFQNAQEARASSQTITVSNPLASRRTIYGRPRTGAIRAHISTSTDNKYLFLVLILCDGTIEDIEGMFFDDELVTLDGTAEETTLNATGKFAGFVRLQKHFGADDQVADSDLVTDLTEWTSDHRLRGIAYVGLRLTFSTKVFPNGMPNISFIVKGANNVIDGRDDSTGFTTNPALCVVNYLAKYPGVVIADEVHQTTWDAAANSCAETVALDSSGTFSTNFSVDANALNSTAHGLHSGQIVEFTTAGTLPNPLSSATDFFVINVTEDSFEVSATAFGSPVTLTNDGTGVFNFTSKEFRYSFNGIIDSADSVEEVLKQFRDSFAGNVCYVGGEWYINPGVYETPTLTIDEDMLTGPIKYSPKRGRRERFNTVKGFFIPELNRWQPVEYPQITDSAYVSNDGQVLTQSFDLPQVSTPTTANRIAKIFLESARLEKTLQLECNIEALEVRANSTVTVNLPRLGINGVVFNVDVFDFSIDGGRVIVSLSLSETSASVFSWSAATDEQSFTITPEPDLTDGQASTPTGLALANNTDARDLVSVQMTWDATTDEFVLQGGFALVEWKKSADSDWQSQTVSPSTVEFVAKGLAPDTDYDFRVAWRNKWGGDSDFQTLSAHQTQSSTTSAFNYKHTQAVPSTTWTITHNLGYRPSIGAVFDGSGNAVNGGEEKGSAGNPDGTIEIEISFTSAISGEAYLS